MLEVIAPSILILGQITDADMLQVGAKALHLAQLRRMGLPVPDGFVLTAGAASGQMDGDPELQAAVAHAYAAFGDNTPVAVRSSAIGEDGATASFAGQFLSVMPVVGLEALLEAVAACRASAASATSTAYRKHHGQDQPIRMAVLVQRYIPAEAAGVLFTSDPVSGDEDTFVVEATRGPGAPLVAGSIRPDRYLLARDRGELREQTLADPDGEPVLTPDHLRALVAFGDQIEEAFGAPQDIEWAIQDGRIALLQARPITALHIQTAGQWTSANFREVLPGIVSPFTFSINLQRSFVEATTSVLREIGVARADEPVMEVRRFFGHPYWRFDYVKRMLGRLPSFSEQHYNATVGMATQADIPPTPLTLATVLQGVNVLRRIGRLYRTFPPRCDAYIARFWQQPHLRRATLAQASNQQVANWVRIVIEQQTQVCDMLDVCAMLCIQAQNDFQTALQVLNQRLPEDEQLVAWKLLTGIGKITTTQPLLLLWQIAQAVTHYPGVVDLIRDTAPALLPEALQHHTAGRAFWNALLVGYLEHFAWLSVAGEDVTAPRWEEQPEHPLTLLRMMLTQDLTQNPARHADSQVEISAAEEARLRHLRWRYPWLVKPVLRNLHLVRQFTTERERLRTCVGVAHHDSRCALLEQGQRWTGAFIDAPDDLFWLEADEIVAALDGRLGHDMLSSRIAARRAQAWRYRHYQPPAVVGQAKPQDVLMQGLLLQGVPCGAGVVEGPARVLQSPGEADQIQPGEILVAPATNPNWAPLFGLVRGIVTEEGGLLSHTSVIARECGIPMVVQVLQATRQIHTGQRLQVDGEAGTVTLL